MSAREALETAFYLLVLLAILVPLALIGFWWLLIPRWRGPIRTVIQGREYG